LQSESDLESNPIRVSPLMRPSTTALQSKSGAGCPTLTRSWVAIVYCCIQNDPAEYATVDMQFITGGYNSSNRI
jgi:hypothetical protein